MKRLLLMFTVVLVVLAAVFMSMRHKADAPATTAKPSPTGRYVAMGDSVAAGLGLKTASDWQYCGRTKESYPELVASRKNLQLDDVACRGATYTAGILGSQNSNGLSLPPQIEVLAGKTSVPDLISITSGANDIGWTDVLQRCYAAECGNYADTLQIDVAAKQVVTNLRATLAKIAETYPKKTPTTIVTGYYNVLPEARTGDCLEQTGIDPSEATWWHDQQDILDSTLQEAIKPYSFARFASVNFSGHDSCSADPWVQGLTDPAPFHPTAGGQQALANAVLAADL